MRRALRKYIDTHERNNLTLIYESFGNKTIQNIAFPLQVAVRVDVPMAEFYGWVELRSKDEKEESVFILRIYEDKVQYVVFKETDSDIELALKYYRQGHCDDEWTEADIPASESANEIVHAIHRIAKNHWSEYSKLKEDADKGRLKFTTKEKVLVGIVATIVLMVVFFGMYVSNDGNPLRIVISIIIILTLNSIISKRAFKKYRRKKDMNTH